MNSDTLWMMVSQMCAKWMLLLSRQYLLTACVMSVAMATIKATGTYWKTVIQRFWKRANVSVMHEPAKNRTISIF